MKTEKSLLIHIDDWNIGELKEIYRGNYSKVYSCSDLGRKVKNKLILKVYDSNAAGGEETPEREKKRIFTAIEREIRILNQMREDSKGEESTILYEHRVVRHVNGEFHVFLKLKKYMNLSEFGIRIGDTEQVVKFIKCISSSLNRLHSLGYIHRDIKLSNILVNEKDNFILSDFGGALCADQSEIVTGVFCPGLHGSYPYMSEQVRHESIYSANSDIYALGICALKLSVGEYESTDPQYALSKSYISPSSLIYKILNKMTGKRDEGYTSTSQLLEDLKKIETCYRVEAGLNDVKKFIEGAEEETTMDERYASKFGRQVHAFWAEFSSGKSTVSFNSAVALAMKNRKKSIGYVNLSGLSNRWRIDVSKREVKGLEHLANDLELELYADKTAIAQGKLVAYRQTVDNLHSYHFNCVTRKIGFKTMGSIFDILLDAHDELIIDDFPMYCMDWLCRCIQKSHLKVMFYAVTTPYYEWLSHTSKKIEEISGKRIDYKIIINSNPGYRLNDLETIFVKAAGNKNYYGLFGIEHIYEEVLKAKFYDEILYNSHEGFSKSIERILNI